MQTEDFGRLGNQPLTRKIATDALVSAIEMRRAN